MMRDLVDRLAPSDRGRFGDNEIARRPGAKITGKSDVDLTLSLRLDDPRKLGIAVADPAGDQHTRWIWLPRSQIKYHQINNGTVEVTMPVWLAREKGLIK